MEASRIEREWLTMKRWTGVLAILMLALATSVGGTLAQTSTPQLDSPWEQIPVEGAMCARGTPYSFLAHSGSPAKLMVYFQGGGACWNADTCKPGGTFTDTVDFSDGVHYGGIFDLANPQNPVADYSIVVVTYCTGDVHTGQATREFSVGGEPITIHFDGFSNAQAVLAWVYAHYDHPSQLIVTGSSAGAYGAVFNAPYLLAHYPDAQATVFGDAGIGVVAPDWDGFNVWNTMANVAPQDQDVRSGATFTDDLYTAAAHAFPSANVAEYSSYGDQVQTGFYALMGGVREDWVVGLETSLADLDKLDNFRSYVGWGETHTVLSTPLFYLMQVNGVPFRDWFAHLIAHEPLDDVKCDDCVTPELASGN
jgi:hypothetical protein